MLFITRILLIYNGISAAFLKDWNAYNMFSLTYLCLVIIHPMTPRLDRPCSGVIVFAKTISAASKLNLSFKNRLVDKNYVCVVNGETEQKQCLHNLMQKTQEEKVNVFDISKDKANYLVEAKLQYESLLVIQGGADINSKQTLIKVELDTGRKHQIRAQMSHIGKQ